MFRFRFLGAFEAHHGQVPMTALDKARPRNLLAYLLLHRDQELTRHGLAQVFWPSSAEAQARTNLRNLLHRLRQALPDPEALIDVSARHVGIRPDAEVVVDVHSLEALAAAIGEQEEDSDHALEELERAASLCRGPLLPGCRDEWVFPHRERLERVAAEVVDDLATAYEARQDPRSAIRVSRAALSYDPGNEALHRRLVRLLAADGDRAAALRAYHGCVGVLHGLGATPSEALETLAARLRSGEGAPPSESAPSPRGLPFVGRHEEWRRLTAAIEAIAPGTVQVVNLLGDAGVGKTRLADEVRRWAGGQGLSTASARCYAPEGRLVFAPVAELLRSPSYRPVLEGLSVAAATELSRILPELRERHAGLPEPGPLETDWQRTRFFEAMTRAATSTGRGLVMHLDDVQWSDPATVQWLHHLVRRGAGEGLVLLLTERVGERARPDLRALEHDLSRDGQWVSVPLGALSTDEATTLASALVRRPAESGLVERLCAESEGNALFLVELARGVPEGASSLPDELPERLRGVILGRLARLGAAATELARVAAVIGGEVRWDVLAHASGRSAEEATEALDELWEHEVLRERGDGAYGFSHDKIREALASGLPPGRRRRIHHRVADGLESLMGRDQDEWAVIATHREAAGETAEASAAHLRAAKRADRVYANETAIHHLRRGLELVRKVPPRAVDPEPYADAAVRFVELLMRGGGAEASQVAAREAVTDGGHAPLDQARLLVREAVAWASQNLYDDAMRCLAEAEAELVGREDATLSHRRVWIDVQLERMRTEYWRGNAEAIASLAERTGPWVADFGAPRQGALFHANVVNMMNRRDRYASGDEIVDHTLAALEAARDSGDRPLVAEMLFLVGFNRLWAGAIAEAAEPLRASSELGRETGYLWLELRAETYLSFWARRAHAPELLTHIEQSEKLAEAMGKAAYVAVAQAHRAVIALREGRRREASELAAAARTVWNGSKMAYPFQWCGLLVELAVHVHEGCPSETAAAAATWVTTLLDPRQQRLPEPIEAALKGDDLVAVVSRARELGFV